ncbi:MAG TPA: hypothetical protein VN540_07085 [Clostridia bacterium]|nr:hypothetical protein [Clostridia bacterium]
MKLRRFLALFFALALLLGAVPALAAGADASTIEVTLSDANSSIGAAFILVTINNTSDEAIALTGAACTSKRALPATLNLPGGATSIPIAAGDTYQMLLSAGVATNVTGSVTETLEFTFFVDRAEPTPDGTYKKSASVALNFGTPTVPTPDPTGAGTAFKLSAYDANKKLVSTPSGDAGEKITIRLPLMCLQGPVEQVSVAPKLSTSLDEWPFAIEQMDYTYYYNGGSVATNQIIELTYALRLAKKVTAGVKKVDFLVSYSSGWGDGSKQTQTVSVYVNVVNGYVEPTTSAPPTISQPKLIVEKYSVSSDKIYAGEEFEVYFTIKNTSSAEAVKNIQISISDTAETGKILPAKGGSNTIYIDRIDAGESYDVTYKMQSSSDIDPKAYKLGVAMAYEGAKNVAPYTASDTISVTIMQKIRLKFDTPVFYDEFYVGQTCGVYLAMYNMGRSSVYNCMVSLEGDGLQMEETFFGGTVSSGGTMSADFNIITNTPGQIEGFIIVTYEDSLGEQMEERIPISIYVNDMGGGEVIDPGVVDPGLGGKPGMEEPGIDVGAGVTPGGLPLWAWIAIGVGVLGCGGAVLLVLRKKRAKHLEDV